MKTILITVYLALFLCVGGAIEFTVGTSDWFVWFVLTCIFFLLALIPFSILFSPLLAFLLLFKQDDI